MRHEDRGTWEAGSVQRVREGHADLGHAVALKKCVSADLHLSHGMCCPPRARPAAAGRGGPQSPTPSAASAPCPRAPRSIPAHQIASATSTFLGRDFSSAIRREYTVGTAMKSVRPPFRNRDTYASPKSMQDTISDALDFAGISTQAPARRAQQMTLTTPCTWWSGST
jgi:hypothetical protein